MAEQMASVFHEPAGFKNEGNEKEPEVEIIASYRGVHFTSKYWVEPHTPYSNVSDTFHEHLSFIKLYRRYFVDKEHFNYLTNSSNYGSIIMSVRQELNDDGECPTKVLLRTKDKTYFYKKSLSEREDANNRHSFSNPLFLAKKVLPDLICPGLCPIPFVEGSKLIAGFDEFSIQTNFKFGVIYQRAGQYTESELLSNTEHSTEFDRFLSLLGDRIKLKGFGAFRGGLDVSTPDGGNDDSTELCESVYTTFNLSELEDDYEASCDQSKETIEVMYHVSTMLPFTQNDNQQLARKRHIGNDILTIVFQEPGAIFNPDSIPSNFLHIFVIVQPCLMSNDDKTTRYQVITVGKTEVPHFKPIVQLIDGQPQMFEHSNNFRQFLLKKIINGEMAATEHASTFEKIMRRTRRFMFETLFRELLDRCSELSEPFTGLCSPSAISNNKHEDSTKNGFSISKDSIIYNKRAGSLLRSIKRTLHKTQSLLQRPHSSSSATDESTLTDDLNRERTQSTNTSSEYVRPTSISMRLPTGQASKKNSQLPPTPTIAGHKWE